MKRERDGSGRVWFALLAVAGYVLLFGTARACAPAQTSVEVRRGP